LNDPRTHACKKKNEKKKQIVFGKEFWDNIFAAMIA
jgi:hypothetical protein